MDNLELTPKPEIVCSEAVALYGKLSTARRVGFRNLSPLCACAVALLSYCWQRFAACDCHLLPVDSKNIAFDFV